MYIPHSVNNFSSVQSLSRVRLFVTPWTAAHQASLSITNTQSLLRLLSIESVMPSNHLILCHPLLLLSSIFPSIRVFSNESASSHQVAKVLEFQLQHQSFQWTLRIDLFRMGWLDLLAVQGTLKNLLQHHSSKASILLCSALFIVQLSHPCMSTGKTIVLARWTFIGKVMSLLFNMLSRLVITFLPRSKCLLISWLQSPSAVILEPKKIKSISVSIVSPHICHDGLRLHFPVEGLISGPRASKPIGHKYWACGLQLLQLAWLKPVLHCMRNPCTATRESPWAATKMQCHQK